MTAAAVAFTSAMVIALVWSEANRPQARRTFKMLASSGFLVVATTTGAVGSSYGRWILLGLVCSWLGDLLLTIDSRAGFLGGLIAFLLAQVAYGVGFVVRGIAPAWALATAVPIAIAGVLVFRWLRPHLDAALRGPVLAYVAVISLMVIAAAGTVGVEADWRIAAGAAAFYLSDLAVARNQFVAPGFVNRAWGLPLYYLAQLLLALSTG